MGLLLGCSTVAAHTYPGACKDLQKIKRPVIVDRPEASTRQGVDSVSLWQQYFCQKQLGAGLLSSVASKTARRENLIMQALSFSRLASSLTASFQI